MPPCMALRINIPTRDFRTKEPIAKPAESAEGYSRDEQLRQFLGGCVSGLDVVFVHARDAEEAESNVVYFEADAYAEERVEDCEGQTV